MDDNPYPPRVLSEEEIDMYLKGDRRDIDKLILYGLNRITAVVVPQAEREERFIRILEDHGGLKGLEERALYVESLIQKNKSRAAMMDKVASGFVLWVLIAFVLFLAHSVWTEAVSAVKQALSNRPPP